MVSRTHTQWVHANCLTLWGGFPLCLAILSVLLSPQPAQVFGSFKFSCWQFVFKGSHQTSALWSERPTRHGDAGMPHLLHTESDSRWCYIAPKLWLWTCDPNKFLCSTYLRNHTIAVQCVVDHMPVGWLIFYSLTLMPPLGFDSSWTVRVAVSIISKPLPWVTRRSSEVMKQTSATHKSQTWRMPKWMWLRSERTPNGRCS